MIIKDSYSYMLTTELVISDNGESDRKTGQDEDAWNLNDIYKEKYHTSIYQYILIPVYINILLI